MPARFRLRTLLGFLTISCVWLAFHVRASKDQRTAVQQLGGPAVELRYDFQFPSGEYAFENYDPNAKSWVPKWLLDKIGIDFFHSVVTANLMYSEENGVRVDNTDLSNPGPQLAMLRQLRDLAIKEAQASDETCRNLRSLKHLKRLHMFDPREVTDAGIMHLSDLKQLTSIYVGSMITDEALKTLGELPNLEVLNAVGCELTDDGLKHLVQAKKLRELHLFWQWGGDKVQYSDTGIGYLTQLRNLEHLSIASGEIANIGLVGPPASVSSHRITDVGILQLTTLRKLKSVQVFSNDVTPQGVKAVRKRLPAVRFELYHQETSGMQQFWKRCIIDAAEKPSREQENS